MAARMTSVPRLALLLLLSVALAAEASAEHLLRESDKNTAAASAGHGPVLQRAKRFLKFGAGLSHQFNLGTGLEIGRHPGHGNGYGYGYPPPPPPRQYYGHAPLPYSYNNQPYGYNYNYPIYPAPAPASTHSQSSSEAYSSGSGKSYSGAQSVAHGWWSRNHQVLYYHQLCLESKGQRC
ncbi:uncharacterized protein LOC126356234 isoform X1 [Schistocerca gregaria]|uniref:uncharacterized protein LOC126356234 isoform X1 n=1 Tax=Schistocerca gregaria TaxID=7010 RepID=UPI00211E52C0|nr:uncharacterized protein LOC126356234 isoform X1 [Schistocerca gregaria]